MNIEITNELKSTYQVLIKVMSENTRIDKELTPLNLEILIDSKLAVSDEYIGEGRAKYPKGTLITTLFDVYLASDDDARVYFKKCHDMYIKRGYKVEENYCPILMSRSKLVDAEHAFIDESMYLVKSTDLKREQLNIPKARKEYIALTLTLVRSVVEREDKLTQGFLDLTKEVLKELR